MANTNNTNTIIVNIPLSTEAYNESLKRLAKAMKDKRSRENR